jgi:hypothetical protein
MSVDQGNNNGGAVAGSFTMSAQLPNGKNVTFSGYVLQGEDVGTVNDKLDLAAACIERQRLIAEIPVLEKELSMREDAKSQLETIISSLTGKDKLVQREKDALHQHRVNLQKVDEDIRKGQKAIATAMRVAKIPTEAL